MPPLRRRRSRDRLSHLRLRAVQRLPPRLHDLLHQREVPPRLRLAARWRHGRIPARRGEGPDPSPRRTHLRRWRPGGLWPRPGLTRTGEDAPPLQPPPAELTYADGAQVACGFGTVYEGLEKIGISGNHAVLITGLGPVGLATGAL